MTEQPAERPKWRRRRAVWLVLIVALVGGSGWWRSRPQIDPRLVGKWCITTPTITTPMILWELGEDGSGAAYQYLDASRPSYRTPLSWSVEDGVLTVAETLTPMRYLGRMHELLAGVGRKSTDMAVWKVVSVSDDEFQCDFIDSSRNLHRWTFARVPAEAQPPVPPALRTPSPSTESSAVP